MPRASPKCECHEQLQSQCLQGRGFQTALHVTVHDRQHQSHMAVSLAAADATRRTRDSLYMAALAGAVLLSISSLS